MYSFVSVANYQIVGISDTLSGAMDDYKRLLAANGIEVTESSVITAASEDNYSAELTGAELLEAGKVYVALTDGGKQIEGIDGGQGAQLIVFGDQNSKRAVRYLKTISVK